MTLDLVKVSLNNLFAEGQAYVALSRARSLDGLQIIGQANGSSVKTSEVVRRFYAAIQRGEKYSDDAWQQWTACNGSDREDVRLAAASESCSRHQ